MTESGHVVTDDQQEDISHQPLQKSTATELDFEPSSSKSLAKRLKKDRVFRKKFLYTVFIWWLFFVFGWKVAQQGPSLLDLQAITGTTLEKASAVFTSDSIGYLTGSFLSGFLFRKISCAILFLIVAAGSAAVTAVIPWCAVYELMILVYLIKGIFDGMVDTVSNAELFRVWKTENAVYVQALHFVFTIGSTISPSVTAPFLLPIMDEPQPNSSTGYLLDTNISYVQIKNNTWLDGNITVANLYKDTENVTNISKQQSQLYIANSITAALYISSAILFLIFYLKTDKTFYRKSSKRTSENKIKTKTLTLRLKIVAYCLLGCLTASFAIFDTSFYGFLTAFCVRHLKWTKTTASHISSMYWGTFCLGRFTAIFVQKFLTSSKLLVISSSTLSLVFTGLLLSSRYFLNVGVWICVGLSGFVMSPILPTILTWTDSELMPVTGFITSLVFISGAVGGTVIPILLGFMMDNIDAMTFCYLILGDVILFVCLFIIALCFAKLFGVKRKRLDRETDIDVTFTDAKSENRSNDTTED